MSDNIITGEKLNKQWKVGALHALYREDGKWYHHLTQFPGALFDKYGFIIFQNENEYLSSEYLQHKQDLHIPSGISSIPGYKKFSEITELFLIESWEDIIETFQNFNSSIETSNSVALIRLNQFFHWYYLPSLDIFAPSKFLGYKGMTLLKYNGEGTGTDTQKALENYFIKLDPKSQQYNLLLTKLEVFLQSMEKEISKKTISGSGGIYIPKNEYDILNRDFSKPTPNEPSYPDYRKPGRVQVITSRIIRDTELAREIKQDFDWKCQICGKRIILSNNRFYAEGHHLIPLGGGHDGLDIRKNIIILCPFHHAEFDYGSIAIDPKTKKIVHVDSNNEYHYRDLTYERSDLEGEFIEFHYNKIFRGSR